MTLAEAIREIDSLSSWNIDCYMDNAPCMDCVIREVLAILAKVE